MAASIDLRDVGQSNFDPVLQAVDNATVFVDDVVAEFVRTVVGPTKFFEAGAETVQRLESPGTTSVVGDVDKVVVVLGSELVVAQSVLLELLIVSRPTKSMTVFCSLTELEQQAIAPGSPSFVDLRNTCLDRLQAIESDATVTVVPFCLGPAAICHDMFFMPQCLGEVMPGQRETQLAAMNLAKLLDGIDAISGFRAWSIGPASKQVVESINQYRNSSGNNKTHLIVVDRSLDLVGPLSAQTNSALDRILRVLPQKHSAADRQIEPKDLLTKNDFCTVDDISDLAGVTLYHPQDDASNFLLESMACMNEKDGLGEVRKVLLQIANKAKIKLPVSAKMGKVSFKQLKQYLEPVLAFPEAFNGNSHLLQMILVAADALEPSRVKELNLYLSAEKTLIANALENDCEGLLEYLTDLVPVKNIATSDGDERVNLTFEEIRRLALVAYSLGIADYDEELELQFQKVLSQIASPEDVSRTMESLDKIRVMRDDFGNFRNLISDVSFEYESLLRQVATSIFDLSSKSKIPDLVEMPTENKGVLSQGIGLFGGMMGISQGPSDCQTLVIAVMGGITCDEVHGIKKIAAKYSASARILFGGSRMIATSESVLESLFC